MSAKEMAEQKGWKVYEYNDGILRYEKETTKGIRFIFFDRNKKTVEPNRFHSIGIVDFSISDKLDMDELKIVVKQCKELRWLDE